MDEDFKVQVCRLCFNLISDKNFFHIKDSLKNMLQVIIDLDLDATNSPVMCDKCSKSLQELFNFKTNFFESEEKIDSKMGNVKHEKLNLRDIMNNTFNNRPKRKSTRVKFESNRLCRTCLEKIKGETCISLNKDTDICLSSMLDSCLPELDLNLTSDPVMCQTCYKTLRKMKDFQSICKKNESQIEAYLKKMYTSLQKKVNLHSVLHFLFTQSNIPETVIVKGEPGKGDEEGTEETNQNEIKDCMQYVMVKMEPDDEEFGTETVKPEPRQELSGIEDCLEYVMVKMEPTDEDGSDQDKIELNLKDNLGNRIKVEPIKVKTEELNNQRSQSIRSSKRLKQNEANDKDTKKRRKMTYCSACKFKTKYKYNLRRHLIVAHKQKNMKVSQKSYQCEQCDFATKWNIDLTRHMLSHIKPEALQCTRCLYSTNQNSQFIKHILSHVNVDDMEKYRFLQLNKKTH